MQDIVIFGAGGFGREVQWLIERINEIESTWNIVGYIDDGVEVDTDVDGYRVLGGIEYLSAYKEKIAVVVAIANVQIRKKVVEKISNNKNLRFPNLIDSSAIISNRVEMGIGNIICSGTIVSVDSKMNNYNVIDWNCTIGHDVVIGSFITAYPSVNISGSVTISTETEIGTGTQIIQGKSITDNVIIGAGSVVVKDVKEAGTYIGIPVRKIRE